MKSKLIKLSKLCRETLGASCQLVFLKTGKFKQLREYAKELVAAPIEHVEEELLSAEELVMVLVIAAYWIQIAYAMERSKLPFESALKKLITGECEYK